MTLTLTLFPQVVFNPATLGKNVKLNSLEELRNFLRSLDYDGPIPPWLYEVIDIMEEEQVPCKLYHTRTCEFCILRLSGI